VKIRKDTKLALMNSAKAFILYITACSNDFCHSCSRTTIGAIHVLGAIEELEFEGMSDQLKELLADFKKEQQSKKTRKRPIKQELSEKNEALQDDFVGQEIPEDDIVTEGVDLISVI